MVLQVSFKDQLQSTSLQQSPSGQQELAVYSFSP
jgi:hypothetical protein